MSYTSRYLILYLTVILPLASVTPAMSQCDEKKEQQEAKETETSATSCPMYPMMFMGNLIGYYATRPGCGEPHLWWSTPVSPLANCSGNGTNCHPTLTDKNRALLSRKPEFLEKAEGVTLDSFPRPVLFTPDGEANARQARVFKVGEKPARLPAHPMGDPWGAIGDEGSRFGYEDSDLSANPVTAESEVVDAGRSWIIKVTQGPRPMHGTYEIFKSP